MEAYKTSSEQTKTEEILVAQCSQHFTSGTVTVVYSNIYQRYNIFARLWKTPKMKNEVAMVIIDAIFRQTCKKPEKYKLFLINKANETEIEVDGSFEK